MDCTYGKLVLRTFTFFFSADFSSHSFLKNAWGRFVYEKYQGAGCHGNDRIKLLQMQFTAKHSDEIKSLISLAQHCVRYLESQ